MEQSSLSISLCFYQLGLCSVTYTANEYSIYHFCVIIKDFSISFSRLIIVQDFETVIFYVLFGCKQIILEIGITLAIKIDELPLCLILNNYIAAHIADYLTITLVGLHLIGLIYSLLDSLPATNQQTDGFK